MNSIVDLYTAIITNDIDETDCKNWNLTAAEYMPQIKLALAHKYADSL